MSSSALPVVIIGAGPVGLAAAAHVRSRNLTPLVFEAGASAGAGIRRWGHVRMFSPWKFNVDMAAVAILERHGWVMPEGDAYPTGRELVDHYLEPLAGTGELAPFITFNARVTAVARQDHDLKKDAGRETAPFLVRVAGPDGEQDVLAQAVIDASGMLRVRGTGRAAGDRRRSCTSCGRDSGSAWPRRSMSRHSPSLAARIRSRPPAFELSES